MIMRLLLALAQDLALDLALTLALGLVSFGCGKRLSKFVVID